MESHHSHRNTELETGLFDRDFYIAEIIICVYYTLRHTVTTNNTSKDVDEDSFYIRVF